MAEAHEKLPERLERSLEALTDVYKGVLRSGPKTDVAVLERAASLYGSARMMAYLLGRECEEQVARSLELVKEELRRVAEHFGEGKEAKETDVRKAVIRLVALEAVIRQIAAQCVGVEN